MGSGMVYISEINLTPYFIEAGMSVWSSNVVREFHFHSFTNEKNVRKGLASAVCIGGGQGSAAIWGIIQERRLTK